MSNGKMPDLNALMKQAQKLQGDVAKVQEELAADDRATAPPAAGWSPRRSTASSRSCASRSTSRSSIPNDVGMLEDLVTAAVNAAATKVRETSKEKMSAVMGGRWAARCRACPGRL